MNPDRPAKAAQIRESPSALALAIPARCRTTKWKSWSARNHLVCHDRAPLSDSLLPLTATCGGLFTSCHRLPHVGEQSVLIHSTVCSISLAPVTHFPSPIYSGLCPLSVSVCHLWFVLPVVEDLLSFICILCPGSPGEE